MRVLYAALIALCLAGTRPGGDAMNPRIVNQDGFTVIGIAARTSNTKEMTPEGVIGKQWARFFQEDLLKKIPNKRDQSLVAVYTDYASDHNGEYTFLLGARVTSEQDVPPGMDAKKIPGGKFAVFTSAKGPGARVVPEVWRKINSLPKSSPGGDRLYRADYELYDQRSADPQNLEVDLYVGIK
jgi:predicted transcriptional regulator YdeE